MNPPTFTLQTMPKFVAVGTLATLLGLHSTKRTNMLTDCKTGKIPTIRYGTHYFIPRETALLVARHYLDPTTNPRELPPLPDILTTATELREWLQGDDTGITGIMAGRKALMHYHAERRRLKELERNLPPGYTNPDSPSPEPGSPFPAPPSPEPSSTAPWYM